MIKIYMFDNKWRIKIGDEVWEFKHKEVMMETLDTIIGIKDEYGRIDDE